MRPYRIYNRVLTIIMAAWLLTLLMILFGACAPARPGMVGYGEGRYKQVIKVTPRKVAH